MQTVFVASPMQSAVIDLVPGPPSVPPFSFPGALNTSACGTNTFSLDGASSCSSCLAGSSSTSGSNACTCNAGYFSANGLSTSQPCTSTGALSQQSNLIIMQPKLTCWPTRRLPRPFASVRVRSRPLVCPTSTYSSSPGSTTCTACPAGYYTLTTGNTQSSACVRTCSP